MRNEGAKVGLGLRDHIFTFLDCSFKLSLIDEYSGSMACTEFRRPSSSMNTE